MENTVSGVRVIHRQSLAPDLIWRYFGTQLLNNFGAALAEGTSVGEYQIVSRSNQGDHDLVTLDINTGDATEYFFKIEVSAE